MVPGAVVNISIVEMKEAAFLPFTSMPVSLSSVISAPDCKGDSWQRMAHCLKHRIRDAFTHRGVDVDVQRPIELIDIFREVVKDLVENTAVQGRVC
jgi:hypothetical protein